MDPLHTGRVHYQTKTLRLEQVHERPGLNSRFSMVDIPELAASIAQVGLLFPPLVVPAAEAQEETGSEPYFLVHGHRRLAALQTLKWESAPFFIAAGLTLADQYLLNLAENGRENLTPAEIAERCADMIGVFKAEGLTIEKLAGRVGYSVKYTQNLIRLRNKLHPDLWAMMVRTGHKAPVSMLLAVVAKTPEEQIVSWNKFTDKYRLNTETTEAPPRLTLRDRAEILIKGAASSRSAEFIKGARWLCEELAVRKRRSCA